MGTLKNLVIAVTGTLQHENTQLKKWIDANGARYSPGVRKGITHLIASRDAWKNASDEVQAAVKLGAFVVSYDWLEDSLQKRRKLAERRYTWEHLWQEEKRAKEMKRLGPLVDAKKFNDGCEEAKKAMGTGMSKSRPRAVSRKPKQSKSFFFSAGANVPFISAAEGLKRKRELREAVGAKKAEEGVARKHEQTKTDRTTSSAPSLVQSSTFKVESVSSPSSETSLALNTTLFQPASLALGLQAKKPSLKDLYHYYLDTTGFEYKIVLARCNLRANEITKYRLSILESHTKPHLYCTFIEYFPPGGNATGSGDGACIQALFDFNSTFCDRSAPDFDTNATKRSDEESQDTPPQTHLPLLEQGLHNHPEAQRLRSVLSMPTPSATLPYKNLIAPMNSTFAIAWRAFRHAFRDLTLLSWEERFDITKVFYKSRAQILNIEPFVYVRPKEGLPLGLRVQQAGLFQHQTLPRMDKADNIVPEQAGEEVVKENDDGYIYNCFNLPALSHPLGIGIIGRAVQNDIDSACKAAEKAKQLADEAEVARLRKLGLARKMEKKPNYSRPLFNGITGRPTTDAWGLYKRGEGGVAGVSGVGGSGLKGGGVVKKSWSRPFPSQRGL